MSKYFIGQFAFPSSGGSTYVNQPYPLDMCVQIGFFSNFAYFECDNDTDFTTVTMTTYAASDNDCSGDEVSQAITYTLQQDGTPGTLYDFNCIGLTNVVTYDVHLAACGTLVGTPSVVTDLCFQYNNNSNITNERYPNIPRNEYYQLSQRYTCTNTSATVQTFVGEDCSSSEYPTYLDEYIATTDCGPFFTERGFDVYGEMLSCVQAGAPTFTVPPTTTTDTDSSTVTRCVQAVVLIAIAMFFV